MSKFKVGDVVTPNISTPEMWDSWVGYNSLNSKEEFSKIRLTIEDIDKTYNNFKYEYLYNLYFTNTIYDGINEKYFTLVESVKEEDLL